MPSGGSFCTSRTFSPTLPAPSAERSPANYKYWTIEAGGTYEIASWNSHGARYATPDTELELFAGGRYWHQQIDVGVALAGTVNVDGLIVSGDRAIARSGTHEWVDPFIGVPSSSSRHPARRSWCAATSAALEREASSPGRRSPPTIGRSARTGPC